MPVIIALINLLNKETMAAPSCVLIPPDPGTAAELLEISSDIIQLSSSHFAMGRKNNITIFSKVTTVQAESFPHQPFGPVTVNRPAEVLF